MIIHVDMDAFYASVEQRDNPQLRGKPVVVGGSEKGRGVVSAASYEAREFGVHSAMSGAKARQLCPHAVFVRGRLDHYAAVGRQIREIFHRFTPIVQPLSLDEAFLDVSGTMHLFGSADDIGHQIQELIAEELDLPSSVGIAPLKFVAKIASDLEKPKGFVSVNKDQLQRFLDPLPLHRLWGVGEVTQERLESLGCRTIEQLRHYPLELLEDRLGKSGKHLWNLANAIDPRTVEPDHNAKQISHERTFERDIIDDGILIGVISYLAEQVGRRLRRSNRTAKRVSVKYRLSDFRTLTRNKSLHRFEDSTRVFFETARDLLLELRRDHPGPIRLIGCGVSEITFDTPPQQMSLFDQPVRDVDKKIDQLTDQIADKLGKQSLYRGESHRWMDRKRNSLFANDRDENADDIDQ